MASSTAGRGHSGAGETRRAGSGRAGQASGARRAGTVARATRSQPLTAPTSRCRPLPRDSLARTRSIPSRRWPAARAAVSALASPAAAMRRPSLPPRPRLALAPALYVAQRAATKAASVLLKRRVQAYARTRRRPQGFGAAFASAPTFSTLAKSSDSVFGGAAKPAEGGDAAAPKAAEAPAPAAAVPIFGSEVRRRCAWRRSGVAMG